MLFRVFLCVLPQFFPRLSISCSFVFTRRYYYSTLHTSRRHWQETALLEQRFCDNPISPDLPSVQKIEVSPAASFSSSYVSWQAKCTQYSVLCHSGNAMLMKKIMIQTSLPTHFTHSLTTQLPVYVCWCLLIDLINLTGYNNTHLSLLIRPKQKLLWQQQQQQTSEDNKQAQKPRFTKELLDSHSNRLQTLSFPSFFLV